MHRFSTVEFLAALIIFFVSAPFVEDLPHGNFVDGSLLTVVLISGLLAVSRSRRLLTTAIILATPAVTARWTHLFRPDLPSHYFLVPGLVFVVFLIANFLHFILRARYVNAEVLCAGISVYLLLGMAWMFAYLLVSDFSPGAFVFTTGPDTDHVLNSFNAYYFSFITLTTVGFGDIAPVSHTARMLAATEATSGTLFMAVLIARLVALYSAQSPNQPGDDSSPVTTKKSD
jgi:glucan phosphoethanolaminetransferase (alkaline phosphatase superfamily)